jgi:hypothetical protein
MPNGVDRTFVRFISCIEGFKTKFNNWPTKVRLGPSFINELKEVMDLEDYRKLTNNIMLIPDESNPHDGLYVAEDDEGNAYDLMQSGHPSGGVDVLGWLDIKWPDYGPDFD